MLALWVLFDVRGAFNAPAAVVCTLGITVAMRVRFDVAGIFTVPSQLAFVPLLFSVPPRRSRRSRSSRSPPARFPRCWRGEVPAGRLLLLIANGWFAVGPAVVVLLAGGSEAVVGSPLAHR